MYPNYKAKGKLKQTEIKEINRRIRDLFTSKIGAVIVNLQILLLSLRFRIDSTCCLSELLFYTDSCYWICNYSF